MRIHVAVIVAAAAALFLASAPTYAKTPLTESSVPAAKSSSEIEVGLARRKAGGTQILSDAQMDKVTAGIGFDAAGYRAALNVWLSGIQSVLDTYTGPGTEAGISGLFSGCTLGSAGANVCTSGTPPPSALTFFK